MKFIRQGISLALLGAGLAAIPSLQAAAHEAPAANQSDQSLVQKLRDQSQGAVTVTSEAATGKVGFVRVARGGDLMPGNSANPADKAAAFVSGYAGLFGASDSQLVKQGEAQNQYGTTVTYVQRYRDVPVFGSEIRVNLDKQGDLTSANGYAAPDLSLSTSPAITATDAASRAVQTVRLQPPGDNGKADTTGIKAVHNDLMVYRMGSTHGARGPALLVYVVEVSNKSNIRDMVFIDAQTGKQVNRYSLVENGLERHLIEANGSSNPATFTNVWNEGDPFPGALNQDQQNEVNFTGDAYWFFKDVFNRDSYDAAGHSMTTVNNDGRISCPNANWNGSTTNYCNGVTADDVVAHEWGHAYTEYTHGLIYQWQSGALNESYSDIWGETVDLINGKLDEGEGDLTTPRPVGVCSSHSPALPIVKINSPAEIAKICFAGAASFGPQLTSVGVTSNIVQGLDDPADGSATNGCGALTNGAQVTGKIALIDRGVCGFAVKTKNAQNAGAIGVVIGNNVEAINGMAGVDDTITIPTAMIKKSDRDKIVSKLSPGPVNVTMKDGSTAEKTDSYRWLMGEKATAFGGAIRDMWSPTCYGDPGKVSDDEYYCATDDGGGVHSNSGVTNHGYALLVDGGTFNGVTVAGIGLDKAAAIYFRAMTNYQTPTTDFADHADSLEAACSDLVGQPIKQLTVTPDATPVAATPVAAADCDSVHAMTQAVELRMKPVQCNFQPMLQSPAPSVCGPGFKQNVVWKDDFEQGLDRWTADQEVVYLGGNGYPWESKTVDGHDSNVAFVPDPSAGNCSGAAGDISSRDSIVSPVIEIPGANIKSPRLTFDHSMASEALYDGGNVKIKVDGAADWTLIPASAYVFNAPGATMASAATNSSPLAGQVGFTGTDGGELTSQWGQSQIDLSKVGVDPGSSVQLRFDFGRDGCGGLTGWAVDNVTISTCKTKVKVHATQVPSPSSYGQGANIDVAVDRDGTEGNAPDGQVVLKSDGVVLDTDNVVGGAATLGLPPTFQVGTSDLLVEYHGGTGAFADESAPVTVKVSKATSSLTSWGRPDPVHRTKTITAKVKVIAPGTTPTGAVKIRSGGQLVGHGMLFDGTARIQITRDFAVGQRSFAVTYVGSDTVKRDVGSFTVRIIS
ncbi:M4 family metallopeptidase [Nocardioides sp.]|uniref:M4 family metallopeptidase n=1 Tax=Nocardioides sp. TaxID=35761 RepID=UPI0031FF2F00|nr:Thermolysin metallopeptidase [Nocardioides sp.]